MDELEALNMLLKLIGSNTVNDVTTNHPDVANARTTLNRIRKRVQKRGWWFNVDYHVIFQPDPTTKEIVIAKEITTFVGEQNLYVVRGGKLYDKINQTFQFGDNVTAHRLTRLLEWDDMPASVQEYCGYFAATEFARDELEDPAKEKSLRESAGIALIDVQKDDLEQGQYNAFNKSRVARARAGVRPYSRGNRRFFGDPDV